MRKPEFEKWLRTLTSNRGGKLKERTILTHLRDNSRVEECERINLDDAFKKDELASILETYHYTEADELSGRKNPTELDTKSRSLSRFLASYKSQLKKYQTFCYLYPPV